MRTSRWMVLVPALGALCILGGALAAAEAPGEAGKAPALTCQKALPAVVVAPAPAPGTAHETNDVCDSTADHGTSPSCEDEANANNLMTCTSGNVTNVTCSVGQSCNSGNGHWCKCKWDCTRAIVIEQIEPH